MMAKFSARLKDSLGKPSGLEDQVAKWLTEKCIAFERQVLLKVYTVDFRIRDAYLEVQGCYWHGCHTCNTTITQRQKSRSERDKSLDTYCNKHGIRLLTIWEHDIDRNDFSALTPLLDMGF